MSTDPTRRRVLAIGLGLVASLLPTAPHASQRPPPRMIQPMRPAVGSAQPPRRPGPIPRPTPHFNPAANPPPKPAGPTKPPARPFNIPGPIWRPPGI